MIWHCEKQGTLEAHNYPIDKATYPKEIVCMECGRVSYEGTKLE